MLLLLGFGVCCLFAPPLALHAVDRPASSATPALPDGPQLAWQTYLMLQKTCTECHGGHLAKPKGKLGYILDLPRLIEEAYVFPGVPEKSDLFTSLVTDDPDLRMPPDDSDGPLPTPEEIEIVRNWIASGAVVQPAVPPAEAAVGADDDTTPAGPTFVRLLARTHPLVIHFPIALLLCAAASELCLALRPSLGWAAGTVRGCVTIGSVAALVAAASGWLHAGEDGFGATADTHRWLGVATAGTAVATLLIHHAFARPGRSRRPILVSLLLAAVMVILAGHTGGVLTYGEDFFLGR